MPMSLGELEAKCRALEALTVSGLTATVDNYGTLVISLERHGLEPLITSVELNPDCIDRPEFDPPVPRSRSLPEPPPKPGDLPT